MYCTYLTTYHGNLLPPYYIGSSSITKIQTGYRGSVSSAEFKEAWNNELLNNPSLFTVEIISTHETRKEALIAELEYQIINNVVNDKLYVRNGFTYGGTNIYFDPQVKAGRLIPNYSIIPQEIRIISTQFDGNGTRFLDYRDEYTVPESGDKYIKFAKTGVFT